MISQAPSAVAAVLQASSKAGCHVAPLAQLLSEIGWKDHQLITHLRIGFPLVDDIPTVPFARTASVRSPLLHSSELQGSAKKSKGHSPITREEQEFYEQTELECKMGRMVRLSRRPRKGDTVTKRFGVWQRSTKGVQKLRCIDDFARSKVNSTNRVRGRIRMGRLSDVTAFLQRARRRYPASTFRYWKSDFKAAYRSCPIDPAHHRFAMIDVATPSGHVLYLQRAMPFGARAAVYAWDRVGAAVQALTVQFLLVLAARYVDDIFGVDFSLLSLQLRRQLMELVDLLGFTFAPETTPEPALEQVILGV